MYRLRSCLYCHKHIHMKINYYSLVVIAFCLLHQTNYVCFNMLFWEITNIHNCLSRTVSRNKIWWGYIMKYFVNKYWNAELCVVVTGLCLFYPKAGFFEEIQNIYIINKTKCLAIVYRSTTLSYIWVFLLNNSLIS